MLTYGPIFVSPTHDPTSSRQNRRHIVQFSPGYTCVKVLSLSDIVIQCFSSIRKTSLPILPQSSESIISPRAFIHTVRHRIKEKRKKWLNTHIGSPEKKTILEILRLKIYKKKLKRNLILLYLIFFRSYFQLLYLYISSWGSFFAVFIFSVSFTSCNISLFFFGKYPCLVSFKKNFISGSPLGVAAIESAVESAVDSAVLRGQGGNKSNKMFGNKRFPIWSGIETWYIFTLKAPVWNGAPPAEEEESTV